MNLVLSQQPSREEANVSGPYDKGANSTLEGVGDSTLVKLLSEDSNACQSALAIEIAVSEDKETEEGTEPEEEDGYGSRATAIRKHCYECVGESWPEVYLCSGYKCHLWPYRLTSSHAKKHPELTTEEGVRQLNREQESKIRGRK